MRRVVLATAGTLAILAASSFVPNRAEAMTVTTRPPSGCRWWQYPAWGRRGRLPQSLALRAMGLWLAARMLADRALLQRKHRSW